MKVTELMIGDWFRYRYTIDNREITRTFRISRIENELKKYYVWGDGFGRMCYPERLEPIPITPEILEKNGFNLRENIVVGGPKFVHEQDDGRTEIVIWLQDGMFMEVRQNIYYEDEICYTLPVPFFVHELQHALRLCGIEKEIEL